MRRLTTTLPLVTALALTTASQGLGRSAPTKATWARAANAMCNQINNEVRDLPAESTEAIWVSDVRLIARWDVAYDAKAAAIPRPPAESRSITRLLADDKQARGLVEQALAALEQGHTARGQSLLAEADKVGTTYNDIARALGAGVCAENPVPSSTGGGVTAGVMRR